MSELEIKKSLQELTYKELKKFAKKYQVKNYGKRKKKELIDLILSEIPIDILKKSLSPGITVRIWNFVKKHKVILVLAFLTTVLLSFLFWLYPRATNLSEDDIRRIANAINEEKKQYLDEEYPLGSMVIAIPPTPKGNSAVIVPLDSEIENVFIDFYNTKIKFLDHDNKIIIDIPKIVINTEHQKETILENVTVDLIKTVGFRRGIVKLKDVKLLCEVLNIHKNVTYVAIGFEES